jgi:protein MpaA
MFIQNASSVRTNTVRNSRRIVAFVLALAGVMVSLTALMVCAPDGHASTNNLTRRLIGRSVQGRAIYAYERGDPYGPTVLVVGSIHGNEPAGMTVAKRLLRMPLREKIDLWVIPNLNPDGRAANRRQNAHGVDLNRNFPWHWRPLTGPYYSGRHSLSEPESRAAYHLIDQIQPVLSIWFHQPLGVVDGSKRSPASERRFARLSGLPLKQLQGRFSGTATSWERHTVPGATAFVAELHSGMLSASAADRYARAVLTVGAG